VVLAGVSIAMTTSGDLHSTPFAEVTIVSDPSEARPVQDHLEQELRTNHFTDNEIFGIKLALEEALVNAIKHGNQMDPAKKVHIAYRIIPHRFDIQITDEGVGFDPEDVPDCTSVENLERPCGRGLMLMRHYMSHVEFGGRGNTVKMFKVSRNGKK
jgi:serine/threonine-protein kinase RsbW